MRDEKDAVQTTGGESDCLQEEIVGLRERKADLGNQIEELQIALERERDACGVLSRIAAYNSERLCVLTAYIRDNHDVEKVPGEDTIDASIRCMTGLVSECEERRRANLLDRRRLTTVSRLVDGLHAVEILEINDPERLDNTIDSSNRRLGAYEQMTEVLNILLCERKEKVDDSSM